MQDSVTEFPMSGDSQSTYSASALLSFADMLLLLLVGLAGIVDGLRIILTKTDTVGSASAGGWLVLLGVLLGIGTLKLAFQGDVQSEQDAAPADTKGPIWLPITALAMVLVYIALIEPLGYTLSTLLFMAVYLRVFGKYGALKIATISIAFALGSSWLWAALDMMLPQGVLPWP
jgi:hypothetical protein